MRVGILPLVIIYTDYKTLSKLRGNFAAEFFVFKGTVVL